MTTTNEETDVASNIKRLWGAAIKDQRLALGWSQKRLAETVKVDQSLVSQWEHGIVAPTVERQLSIARALGVAPRVLFQYPEVA